MQRTFPAFVLTVLAFLVSLAPAMAHPHVTVTARSSFVINDKGQITAIRHAWTFDEAFSAYAVTGLKAGPDGKVPREQLKDLAKVNIESLNEFEFFTVLKQSSKSLPFAEPSPGFYLDHDGKALTLHFDLPLKAAVDAKKSFSLKVSDDTFFVAFEFAENDPIGFAGDPHGCTIEKRAPKKQLDVNEIAKLGESFFNDMKTGFSDQYASNIQLSCPAN